MIYNLKYILNISNNMFPNILPSIYPIPNQILKSPNCILHSSFFYAMSLNEVFFFCILITLLYPYLSRLLFPYKFLPNYLLLGFFSSSLRLFNWPCSSKSYLCSAANLNSKFLMFPWHLLNDFYSSKIPNWHCNFLTKAWIFVLFGFHFFP